MISPAFSCPRVGEYIDLGVEGVSSKNIIGKVIAVHHKLTHDRETGRHMAYIEIEEDKG